MLILFDIDDTLVDHSKAMQSAAAELWKTVRSEIPLEEFLPVWASSLERHYARYLQGELTFQEQRRARIRDVIDPSLTDLAADKTFDAYFTCYKENWSLFADARLCLETLRRHRLGVISNGRSEDQRLKLINTGISEMFECIVISDECGVPKPSAEIFLRACSAAGERPENAVYIGDRYDIDAEGARRAGLHGIWLDRLGRSDASTSPPFIRSLEELPKLISGFPNEAVFSLLNPGTSKS